MTVAFFDIYRGRTQHILFTVIWRHTYMVKDHSYSDMGYSFRLAASFFLYPIDRITHTTAIVKPVVVHLLEREIAQWAHHEGSKRRPSHHERTLLARSVHLASISWTKTRARFLYYFIYLFR